MKRPRTQEEVAHEVVTLQAQGVRRRAIARAVGVSRNTVRKILEGHETARQFEHNALAEPPERAPRPRKVDAFAPKVAELLTRFPDITAQRIFEELRDAGFTGGYTGIKDYVRLVRPRPTVTPSLPTPVWGPGEMAESDWSPHVIPFTVSGPGKVQFFSYVLCFSRRKNWAAFEHADEQCLQDGHLQAFDRNKGAAEACKYDGQKPVVLRWEGQQPIYNPRFLAFATYYEFRPVAPRRPGNPNERPKVERGFWELERSFLNGRSFRDLADLRAQLAHWERTVHDLRPHKQTRRPPLEMFQAEEQAHLVPLPKHPYDTARVVYRLCSIDGFIAWDGNRYAVPYDHVTDILPVRITQHELFVYGPDLRLAARHELLPRDVHQDLDPQGLHRRWQHHAPAADIDQLRTAFGQMGQASADYFAALAAAAPRYRAVRGRQILLLRERYATGDLDAALGHALAYGAFEHGALERILLARAKPRTLDEYVAEHAFQRLEQRLGACTTQPRDLAEYDRLPVSSSAPATDEGRKKDP
jgi:transposase